MERYREGCPSGLTCFLTLISLVVALLLTLLHGKIRSQSTPKSLLHIASKQELHYEQLEDLQHEHQRQFKQLQRETMAKEETIRASMAGAKEL